MYLNGKMVTHCFLFAVWCLDDVSDRREQQEYRVNLALAGSKGLRYFMSKLPLVQMDTCA